VTLWDVTTGQERSTPARHASRVNSLAFSPDGRCLASGGDEASVRLWDLATGEELALVQEHLRSVNSVVFSPDGKTIASGSNDATVRLWDVVPMPVPEPEVP
jgi:WD40 repeat protein